MSAAGLKVARLPKHDAFNGWTNILPARQARVPLTEDKRVHMLVIGAGAAGLAAARRAAELAPDRDVVLLEAGSVGDGASARNSGFVIDLPHNVGADLNDLDTLKRSLRLARGARDLLDDLVETHQIDCQWSRQGQFMAAASPQGSKVLDGFIAGLDALGETYRDIDAAAIKDRLGLTYYQRAIHTPGTVLMQPAALVRGLGDSLPENVSLFENSPVEEITYGAQVVARTRGGTVTADQVILAVNGYAPFLGQLQSRVFTIQAFAGMTRQLTEDEQAALGNVADWGLVPAMPFGGPTMRYTMDHRVIMRSYWGTAQTDRVGRKDYKRARRLQAQQLRDRFPMIKGDAIEHSWTGQLALSSNFAPGFGQLDENVYSAMLQNGVGMTKGTMAGKLAAEMAAGQDSQLLNDMLALGDPVKLPPSPILDIGIKARVKWWEWTSRFER